MREILFRGKRLEIGDWVEGSLIAYPDGDSYIARPGDDPNVLDKFCVDPSSIGEFTGLQDENGKRIFEGDILGGDGGIYACFWDGCNVEFGVKNKDLSFGIAYLFLGEYEVIGNIHDNPELMEVQA